eukprot:6479877-Amphidinium_carterae.1
MRAVAGSLAHKDGNTNVNTVGAITEVSFVIASEANGYQCLAASGLRMKVCMLMLLDSSLCPQLGIPLFCSRALARPKEYVLRVLMFAQRSK